MTLRIGKLDSRFGDRKYFRLIFNLKNLSKERMNNLHRVETRLVGTHSDFERTMSKVSSLQDIEMALMVDFNASAQCPC